MSAIQMMVLGSNFGTPPYNIDYLVVAGGAGGGISGGSNVSGAGGAGGYRPVTAYSVTPATAYTVTIGAGGAANSDGARFFLLPQARVGVKEVETGLTTVMMEAVEEALGQIMLLIFLTLVLAMFQPQPRVKGMTEGKGRFR